MAELPAEEGDGGEEELVTIATFPNASEASIVEGAMRAAGIPAVVPQEKIGSFSRSNYQPFMSWVELKAPKRDRERAIEFLKAAGHK